MLLKSRSFTSEFLTGQGNSREGVAKVALNWSKNLKIGALTPLHQNWDLPCINTSAFTHTSELGFLLAHQLDID